MLYKGDSIYLYIINFSSELNGFNIFAPNNGAKVMSVNTHGTVGNFFICNKSFPCCKTVCMTEKRLW